MIPPMKKLLKKDKKDWSKLAKMAKIPKDLQAKVKATMDKKIKELK